MQYQIKRGNTVLVDVPATGTQQKAIMGTNIVSMAFTLHEYVEFLRDDYCDVYGERYYLNDNPGRPKQENSVEWSYNLELQAKPYTLKRAQYQFYGDDNEIKEPDFSLTTNARGFLDLMLVNIGRIETGWSIGDVDETDAVTLSFSAGDNCLAVLSRLAEQFNTEWWVEGKVIHLTKKGEILPTVLDYGPGKGYRTIERVPIDGKPPITRLFVFGSDKNIPANYRGLSKRLKLPADTYPDYYIEKNVNLYGVWEDTKIFDDVYPRRLGTVTGVIANNKFVDAAIDFDINQQLISGTSAKVEFKTGRLAGYQFEIAEGGYNNAEKSIIILSNKDEKAFEMPSDTFHPEVGDQYVIVDIIMPETYVASGEQDLADKGNEYIDQNCADQYNYDLGLDPFHFRRQGIYLQLGKYMHIKSEKFALDNDMRIVGFTRDLQDPWVYSSVSVSDFLQISPALTADSQQRDIQRAVTTNKLTDINRTRASRKTNAEMLNMIFDPASGNVRNDKLDVSWLQAQIVTVGTQSQDFQITVTFYQSDEANTNTFSWSAGKLIHYIISDNGGIWNIQADQVTGLDPAKAYYIYVKCEKFSAGGQIILSENQIAFEEVADYYHFWVGVLSSVTDGLRDAITLYGVTEISGRRIRTGEFVNTADQPVLDLDTRTFYGSFKFTNGTDVGQAIDSANSSAASASSAASSAQTAAGNAQLAATNAYNLADSAKADAFNAQSTANRAANITDYLFTTIDGNIVATGTLLVGNASGANVAGLTGVNNSQSAKQVRIWAGSTFANRQLAPFRVWDDGTCEAANLRLTGGMSIGDAATIYTDGSLVANNYSIKNDRIFFRRNISGDSTGGGLLEFGIVDMSLPGYSGDSGGYFRAKRTEPNGRSVALTLEASGSTTNIALNIVSGKIRVNNGGTTYDGVTQDIPASSNIRVVNGIVVGTY